MLVTAFVYADKNSNQLNFLDKTMLTIKTRTGKISDIGEKRVKNLFATLLILYNTELPQIRFAGKFAFMRRKS